MAHDYTALRDHLLSQKLDDLTLSFEAIEEIVGFALPRAAHRAAWWDVTRAPDEKMPQREAIIAAGFTATRTKDGDAVRFAKAMPKRRW